MTDPTLTLMKKYPVLEKGQLVRFLSSDVSLGKTKAASLIREKSLAQNSKFIQAYPWSPSVVEDEDTTKAVWVMLDMCKNSMQNILHGPDTYPFSIHFIFGNDMEYRIMFVSEITPRLSLRMADRRPDKESLVFVTETTKALNGLEIPSDVPSVFVLYRRPDYWGLPRITYFKNREMTEKFQ